jgi:peptidoglycan/LPS O-acetylase OafA/YrhL
LLPDLQKYYYEFTVFRVYPFGYGDIGLGLFLFASGCSLAVNDNVVDTKMELKTFYKKRLLRIYPAFWTGLLFSLMMSPATIPYLTVSDYVRELSGFRTYFSPFMGQFFGKINGSYWFISLILSLYLLFPVILKAIKKHPHLTILSLFIIDLGTRLFWVQTFHGMEGGFAWVPFCRLFEFSFGIYLIQVGFYPKLKSNRIFGFVGNLTFYVFLVHVPLLILAYYSLPFFLIVVGVMATMMYLFDRFIHTVR